MGEYGTPNIDIEEGWIDIAAQGPQRQVPVPAPGRQPLSHHQGARHRSAVVLRAHLRPARHRPDAGPGLRLVQRRSRSRPAADAELPLRRHLRHGGEPLPGAGGGRNSADRLRPGRPDARLPEPARHAAMHRACGGAIRRPRASCASSTSSPRHSPSTSWPSACSASGGRSASRSRSSTSTIRARRWRSTTTIRRITAWPSSGSSRT